MILASEARAIAEKLVNNAMLADIESKIQEVANLGEFSIRLDNASLKELPQEVINVLTKAGYKVEEKEGLSLYGENPLYVLISW